MTSTKSFCLISWSASQNDKSFNPTQKSGRFSGWRVGFFFFRHDLMVPWRGGACTSPVYRMPSELLHGADWTSSGMVNGSFWRTHRQNNIMNWTHHLLTSFLTMRPSLCLPPNMYKLPSLGSGRKLGLGKNTYIYMTSVLWWVCICVCVLQTLWCWRPLV